MSFGSLGFMGVYKRHPGGDGGGGGGGMYRSSCLDCVHCYQYDLWELVPFTERQFLGGHPKKETDLKVCVLKSAGSEREPPGASDGPFV